MRSLLFFVSVASALLDLGSSDHIPPSRIERVIVTFEDNINDVSLESHFKWLESLAIPVIHRYDLNSFRGYAADVQSISVEAVNVVMQMIESSEVVSLVQPEFPFTIMAPIDSFDLGSDLLNLAEDLLTPTTDSSSADENLMLNANLDDGPESMPMDISEATHSPWGLGRISHDFIEHREDLYEYIHDPRAGEGVKIYIADTGIYPEHEAFSGVNEFNETISRAKKGPSFVFNEPAEDEHGHGTHCAGIAVGNKIGVAPRASVMGVKVCSKGGTCWPSDTIAGIEYAVRQHQLDVAANTTGYKGAVISLSLGGPGNLVNRVVDAAVELGVGVAVAAGNSDDDSACSSSPSSAKLPLTVGATGIDDSRAFFSCYGPCVDVFAPGLKITSAAITGPRQLRVMSGTSMATPHVAGLLAYYLSTQEFSSITELHEFVKEQSVHGYLRDIRNSPNRLVSNRH